LYLLLWAEETDDDPEEPRHPVSYWLGHIRELAGASPIILVKNQIDRSDRYDLSEFQDQSSSFVQHLKISALNYTGVDTLRGAIKDILGQLRHRWGYRLPTSWLHSMLGTT
jgi:50S ribosomal subunit-associated GTPase HflX